MQEEERKKIIELIRKTIDEVVYDEMRQLPGRRKAQEEEQKKTKAQKEQDVHDALFGKKDDDISYRINLNENEEKPKITSIELANFEKEFKQHFPDINFEKQNNPGQNGEIVDFPVINNQTDACTSGTITLEKNIIKFNMSLLSGLFIESLVENSNAVPFEINNDTKDIFGKLYNLYNTIFKKTFESTINPTPEETVQEPEAMSSEEPNMPEAPVEQPEEEAPTAI